MSGHVEALAGILAEHQYLEVWGDYEIKPYTKQFGCSCGWEQNIAGMSGWRSWLAAHHAHVAEVLAAYVVEQQAQAWDEGYSEGWEDEAFESRGLSTDPDAADYPHHNPYK